MGEVRSKSGRDSSMVPRFAEQRVARFAEHVVAVPVPRILKENSEVVRLTPHGSSYFLPLFYRFSLLLCVHGRVRALRYWWSRPWY